MAEQANTAAAPAAETPAPAATTKTELTAEEKRKLRKERKQQQKKQKQSQPPAAAATVKVKKAAPVAAVAAPVTVAVAAPAAVAVAASAAAVEHKDHKPLSVVPVKEKEMPTGDLQQELLKAVGKDQTGTTITESTAKYNFWKHQPVPGLGVKIPHTINHPIESDKRPEEVRKEPVDGLPAGYHFTVENVNDEKNIQEIYTLLRDNYVEDDDNMFRFDYSIPFLRWALTPPGYFGDWHVGVRGDKDGKMYGFITGIPVTIRISDRILHLAEINFLCVHKTLRSLRLAPLLISEVTRRVHLKGMFQAVYTAGVVLPNPISTCHYYHRSLNPRKLVDVGFSALNQRLTMSRALKLYHVPEKTATPGLRPMEPRDVSAVLELLTRYLAHFTLTPLFSDEEIAHWLLPRKDIVSSYVVEDPKTKKLTGLASFYTLPSSILGNPKYHTLRAAYSFYNFNENGTLKDLMSDALILAKKDDFDVFNCLDVMENETFLKELKFGIGDGKLQYYVFNWACTSLPSSEIGMVLL
eukprot:TRINITY_DN1770_c0_g1_i1.p1 TRINITY_DN1770_c0_g1~~TRINITY_DN1770_c0_g1_i1.p1  ORF type:complete len:534 (+),score=188.15 TRINITY_DN1770_c0_g1_i1:32-1603(+)